MNLSHGMGINHAKRARLRDMKVFVLDNSLRESTVAQVAGHTLNNKTEILEQIKLCGLKDVIVAAFGGLSEDDRRVDDAFCEQLEEHLKSVGGMDDARTYAFTEIADEIVDGKMLYGEEKVPSGLQKMKRYGIPNAIIEIDVNNSSVDWDKFPVSEVIKVLTFLLTWTKANLKGPSADNECRRNMVNLRDLPIAMIECPQRTLELVAAIAKLPKEIRPCALIFEEPLGEYFPDEVANWTSTLRKTMDSNGWKSEWQEKENNARGMLLYHVHEQYGLANATVLDVLAAGGDGMWCSISEEGAPMGHACSAVALTNLARLGNKDVLTRYNMGSLVSAARRVASVTTGKPVSARQVVYGSGAVDVCFGFGSIAQGKRVDNIDYNGDGHIDELDRFSVARLIGLKDPPVRISTLASSDLVVRRLTQCFGDKVMFTKQRSQILLLNIKERLENNIKENYTERNQLGKLWNDLFSSDDSLTLIWV